jgi:hypothetical protein
MWETAFYLLLAPYAIIFDQESNFSILKVKHCCGKIMVTGVLLRQLVMLHNIVMIPATIPLYYCFEI